MSVFHREHTTYFFPFNPPLDHQAASENKRTTHTVHRSPRCILCWSFLCRKVKAYDMGSLPSPHPGPMLVPPGKRPGRRFPQTLGKTSPTTFGFRLRGRSIFRRALSRRVLHSPPGQRSRSGIHGSFQQRHIGRFC